VFQLQIGADGEPVVGHVHADGAGQGREFFFHDKSVTVEIVHFVFLAGFIQSQGQGRTTATALIEIDADGRLLLVGEILVEFGASRISQGYHGVLQIE